MKTKIFLAVLISFVLGSQLLAQDSYNSTQWVEKNGLQYAILQQQGYRSGILEDQSIGEFSIKQDFAYPDQKLIYYRNVVICQVLDQETIHIVRDVIDYRIFVIKDSYDVFVMDYAGGAVMKNFKLPTATLLTNIKKTGVNSYDLMLESVSKKNLAIIMEIAL